MNTKFLATVSILVLTSTNAFSQNKDWNTGQIGIKFGGNSNPKFDGSKLFTAKTYKNARILCYGMGRDGDTWRGAQVDFKDGK